MGRRALIPHNCTIIMTHDKMQRVRKNRDHKYQTF